MTGIHQHDPLGQNAEENELEEAEILELTGTGEVKPAEESAVNIDTETAREASGYLAETDQGLALEKDIQELDEELKEAEKKNKKSKRQSTSEKAKLAQAERARLLSPWRLRGKKYREKVVMVEKGKEYSPEEAVELVKQTASTSFDGAVELHGKVKSESVRGTVTLPHGTGKSKRVVAASDEIIEQIAAGKLDFDVLLATPSQMLKLAKYAKVLGPKGLMPSPKVGTVTEDIEKVTEEIQKGRVEYKADKNGVVHLSIGRVSFSSPHLLENYKTMEQVLTSAKILSMSLSATMGPGIRVAVGE